MFVRLSPSGLESLHNLTTMTKMSLRVDLRHKDESAFAKYSTFEVAKKNYKLTVGGYSGDAGERKQPVCEFVVNTLEETSDLFLFLFLSGQVIRSVTTTTGSSPPKTATRRRSSRAAPCRTEEAGGTRTATRPTSTASTASTSSTR